jgi:hypothetical protein
VVVVDEDGLAPPVDALRTAGRFDPSLEPKLGTVRVSAASDISAELHDVAFIRDS